MGNYGKRQDGTDKGLGFFGEIKRPDGGISTELTAGVNLAGQEVEIPLLTPALNAEEINYLIGGGKPTEAIVRKSTIFAIERLKAGRSQFAEEGEIYQMPVK